MGHREESNRSWRQQTCDIARLRVALEFVLGHVLQTEVWLNKSAPRERDSWLRREHLVDSEQSSSALQYAPREARTPDLEVNGLTL